ncbi:hypothetical protein NECAME_05474 [Necator americanus]|uniref:Uncharacterized protein n=1 Tax=Necator americanus TaxID=51031 RepID=W2SGP6_NECAM|nr:hypothetical protein NECAME_05474 [Necator americanus]ETN68750.1 hypothetical protein NECAME_05474 [Necator americanus]
MWDPVKIFLKIKKIFLRRAFRIRSKTLIVWHSSRVGLYEIATVTEVGQHLDSVLLQGSA